MSLRELNIQAQYREDLRIQNQNLSVAYSILQVYIILQQLPCDIITFTKNFREVQSEVDNGATVLFLYPKLSQTIIHSLVNASIQRLRHNGQHGEIF